MRALRPFLKIYGGKYRASKLYPSPQYETIIEPFAGGAGYSCRYWYKRIVLIEKDPIIAGVWRYLLSTSSRDILALPDVKAGQSVDTLAVCADAKYLIGFWLNAGVARPRKTPSAWMRAGTHPGCFWGHSVRERIARQLESVRHWKIIYGDYQEAPDACATWFIDPPYQNAGRHYRMHKIDYTQLGMWCKTRRGQSIVCENEGADWLPFQYLAKVHSTSNAAGGKYSTEAVWIQNDLSTEGG